LPMKRACLVAIALGLVVSAASGQQGPPDPAATHVAVARAAAGKEFAGVFERVCGEAAPAPATA